jgi:hypothetical protein
MTKQQQDDFRRVVEAAKRSGTLLVSGKDAAASTNKAARVREQTRLRVARFRQIHRG